MKLVPVLTEKSLREAKMGHYTFWVTPSNTKNEIKNYIEKVFDVKVSRVRTMNFKAEVKRNSRGQMQSKKGGKKAVVSLKEGKIDLFTEKVKEK